MLMRNRRVGGDDLELLERRYYPTRKLLVHETRVPFHSLIIDEKCSASLFKTTIFFPKFHNIVAVP